ncbi:hypothetical protein [Massilia eurypsychrophila]|nr:hypothetical protein [Massilia eurypsychrophila]
MASCTFLRLAMVAALALPAAATAGGVTVQISLAGADALDVSYELPEHCPTLAFKKTDGASRAFRAGWRSEDACGKLDGDAISASCRTPRFRVQASSTNHGGFPGAFPMGEGVYVHTSKYAPAETCGKVSYRFVAPGSIALAGKVQPAPVTTADPSAADTSVLLLSKQLSAGGEPAMYFSPSVGADLAARIADVARGTFEFYSAALPNARFRPIVLAANAMAAPGGFGYEGDADHVLRLAFFNWPSVMDRRGEQIVTSFVSHEMSHRFQLRDEIDGYAHARLIHEGGAEFLRWWLAVRKGWVTKAEAAAQLDDALADCMLGAGTSSWAGLTPQQIGSRRLEYRCGLPAYVFSLAARQGKGTALARIDLFYQQVRSGKSPDFAQVLECAGNPGCQPHWLPALLGGTAPLRDEWARLLADSALAQPVAPSTAQRDAMMLQAIGQLMKHDRGSSSLFPTREGVIVDDVTTCKTLRAKMHIVQVEAHPMLGNADALPALVTACAARGELRLGTKDGQAFSIGCSQPAYRPAQSFHAADIERVLANLAEDK